MADVIIQPACTVYLADGSVTLLYRGTELPASSELAEGEAKRLKDAGFVGAPPAAKQPASEKKAAVKVSDS